MDRMAKARDVPGLRPDTAYRQAAAAIVEVRADEVWEHADGVLDTQDIERVHDMRVATRRLRAVLEIFGPCFPRKPLRRALADVKDLANALGERRDPDVSLAALAAYAAAAPEEDRAGVERLRTRFGREQAAGNEALRAALRHAEEADLRGRLRALVEEARG
jgi:CHAD domain-containing protein